MKPYYWALLSMLVWGVAPILEKFGLSKISVFGGLIYRSLGVVLGALMIVLFKFDAVKETLLSSPKDWWFLTCGGLLASILGQIFFYHALKDGEASLVVPLAAAYPLVAFILGVIFLGEQVTATKIAGLAFILVGVFLLK